MTKKELCTQLAKRYPSSDWKIRTATYSYTNKIGRDSMQWVNSWSALFNQLPENTHIVEVDLVHQTKAAKGRDAKPLLARGLPRSKRLTLTKTNTEWGIS